MYTLLMPHAFIKSVNVSSVEVFEKKQVTTFTPAIRNCLSLLSFHVLVISDTV